MAMGRLSWVILLAVLSHMDAPTGAAPQAVKALRFGQLWDGSRLVPKAIVVVKGDRIVSVGTGGAVPPGAETIDLTRFTALPGMIDLHTHMTYFWDGAPGTRPSGRTSSGSRRRIRGRIWGVTGMSMP